MKNQKKTKPLNNIKKLPNDEPVHIPISFEDAIKKASDTPVKNSKVNKKP